jgi:hypothetical protein
MHDHKCARNAWYAVHMQDGKCVLIVYLGLITPSVKQLLDF